MTTDVIVFLLRTAGPAVGASGDP